MQNRYDWLVMRCDCASCRKVGLESYVGEVWDLQSGKLVCEFISDGQESFSQAVKAAGQECLRLEALHQSSGLTTMSST